MKHFLENVIKKVYEEQLGLKVMFNKRSADKNNSVIEHEDEQNFENLNQQQDEVSFSEITQIIELANTVKYGFESSLLEFILCRFIQFGEDNECDTLRMFRKLFTKFSIQEYFESENRIDMVVSLFEYISVAEDVFLPHFTAENFVKFAITEYMNQKHNKKFVLTIRFLVN